MRNAQRWERCIDTFVSFGIPVCKSLAVVSHNCQRFLVGSSPGVSLFGFFQDKSSLLSGWGKIFRVCVCVCVCQSHKQTPRHISLFLLFQPLKPDHLFVCCTTTTRRAWLTHTAACAIIPLITCGFAHLAPLKRRLTLSASCAPRPHQLALLTDSHLHERQFYSGVQCIYCEIELPSLPVRLKHIISGSAQKTNEELC